MPSGSFLRIINSTVSNSYPEQITTSFENTSATKYLDTKWRNMEESSSNRATKHQTTQTSLKGGTKTAKTFKKSTSEDIIQTVYLTPENADSVLQTLTLPSMRKLKRRRKPFTITVEGIVGCGKSTLLSAFKVLIIQGYYLIVQ